MFVLQLDLIECVLDGFNRQLSIVVHGICARFWLPSSEQILYPTPRVDMLVRTVDFNAVHVCYLVIRNE